MEIVSKDRSLTAVEPILLASFAPDGALRLRYQQLADFLPLSKAVFRGLGPGGALLHINEWGIWSSSENWDLFDALCLHHFGRTHRVEAMRFEASELTTATTFLQVSLSFGWGGVLLSDNGGWFRFNHDGFGVFCGENPAELTSRPILGVELT